MYLMYTAECCATTKHRQYTRVQNAKCKNSLSVNPEVQMSDRSPSLRSSLNVVSGVSRVNCPGKNDSTAVIVAAYCTNGARGAGWGTVKYKNHMKPWVA